jgi:predicted metal-dependent hydrolase
MTTQVQVGDIVVDVELKGIKNVHLSVHPPTGRVRISAPEHMTIESIRVFAISKLDWIRKHQATYRAQERRTPRQYIERESHYLWGRRYLLQVREEARHPTVALSPRHIVLTVRPGASVSVREEVVAQWYRGQLKAAAVEIVAGWSPVLGIRVNGIFVRKMRTRWGSCNSVAQTIRLNTELAEKPKECMEYVAVHEMVHLLEPTHNARFIALMDQFMPQWRALRDQLNRLPIQHPHWNY